MAGFARRKEQSKEEIRRAARDLFGQFGVDKVSIADIARKAGVSQATIYNNFCSKEQLAREFVTAVVDELVNRVQDVLAVDRPYKDKMAAFVQFIADTVAHETPPVDGAVFTSSLDLLNDPDIRRIRDAAQERMANLLLALVREGQEQGEVRPGLSEEALRIYFTAFMDVFTQPQLQPRFHKDPSLVRDLGMLMIYGESGKPEG